MEKDKWIEHVLQSTDGIVPVIPADNLFSKIRQRIRQENKVSTRALWLAAASIIVLAMLNFSVLAYKTKQKENAAGAYLEMTLNKSNQLYQ